jgi:hypothetical protein
MALAQYLDVPYADGEQKILAAWSAEIQNAYDKEQAFSAHSVELEPVEVWITTRRKVPYGKREPVHLEKYSGLQEFPGELELCPLAVSLALSAHSL